MAELSARLPRALYQAAQVQQLDRVAIDDFQIEGFTLMRRAGLVSFQALLDRWAELRRVVCFCGAGNNGGDGYIVAGLAREQGLSAQVVAVGDPAVLKGDARRAWEWAVEKGVSVMSLQELDEDWHALGNTVVVDALLGTGLDREVEGQYRGAIDLINDSGLPVLALDIPSGLSANTGMPLGAAVRAQLTGTFIGMKQGLLTGEAANFTGALFYSDLDVPVEVFGHEHAPIAPVQRIDINDVIRFFPSRKPASHKGDYGHMLVIGGDQGMGGAVLMAAEAALRGGAGLVSVLTRSAHRPALLARRPELMVLGTEDEGLAEEAIAALLGRATAIVVGPGLGKSDWSRQQLQRALSMQVARDVPLVVDADGLNLLSEKDNGQTVLKRDNWILTPHPGEAATLLGVSKDDVQADRFAAVARLQEKWGGACLLKGFGSLICGGHGAQEILLSTEGNAGMASGGMGDVLAGLTGSFLAQGLPLLAALQAAVCVHGEAADVAAAAGQRGLLATDLLPQIRTLVNPPAV